MTSYVLLSLLYLCGLVWGKVDGEETIGVSIIWSGIIGFGLFEVTVPSHLFAATPVARFLNICSLPSIGTLEPPNLLIPDSTSI